MTAKMSKEGEKRAEGKIQEVVDYLKSLDFKYYICLVNSTERARLSTTEWASQMDINTVLNMFAKPLGRYAYKAVGSGRAGPHVDLLAEQMGEKIAFYARAHHGSQSNRRK